MNRQQIQDVILRVLSECRETEAEVLLPLDVPVEVSARHVHLTEEAVKALFGRDAELTPKRPLSQPGQFLSEQRVAVVTAKGRLEQVAVLGPVRTAIQTELSAADSRTLGIQAPLRMSGDLEGAADVYLVGPAGMIEAKNSAIVAQAHIHITPSEAEPLGIADGQKVSVTLPGSRPLTLNQVVCRVSAQAALALHIDSDEANACMLAPNAAVQMRILNAGISTAGSALDTGNVLNDGNTADASSASTVGSTSAVCRKTADSADAAETAPPAFEGKLITEAIARKLAAGCKAPLVLHAGVIVTPSAKDVLRQAKIEVIRQKGR